MKLDICSNCCLYRTDRQICSSYGVVLSHALFHQLNIHEEGQQILILRRLQLKTVIKKKGGGLFFLLSLPKLIPVMKLFDVKDDRKAFSCDFTKAFESALVLSFLKHQRRSTRTEKLKLGQSPFCPWLFVLMSNTDKHLDLRFITLLASWLVMDSKCHTSLI